MDSHLGIRRTLSKIRSQFFLPQCKEDIRCWCRDCDKCIQVKPGPAYRAALHQVQVNAPLDGIAPDIFGMLPEKENGKVYILVVSGYFTKWTEKYALKDHKVQLVVDVIMNEFISRFGVHRKIHTDQGWNFESGLFTELCKLFGIVKTRTTPYWPQSNGQIINNNNNWSCIALDPKNSPMHF